MATKSVVVDKAEGLIGMFFTAATSSTCYCAGEDKPRGCFLGK